MLLCVIYEDLYIYIHTVIHIITNYKNFEYIKIYSNKIIQHRFGKQNNNSSSMSSNRPSLPVPVVVRRRVVVGRGRRRPPRTRRHSCAGRPPAPPPLGASRGRACGGWARVQVMWLCIRVGYVCIF